MSIPPTDAQFRLLVDGVRDYGIFMLDPTGRVVSWNVGASLIKGYTADEIIGQHFSKFYTGEAIERGWPAHELAVATAQGRFEDEGWRLRRDGSHFWASVSITALRDSDGALAGFAKVTRDLTDRQRLEALVQSTREMTEFLAMLSHELRNPLAPIRNAVAVLEMQASEDPTVRWSREVIGRQAAHMARLVDDLLDVSRMTSGKIVLAPAEMDLRPVVAHAFEAALPQTAARHHVLNVSVPEHPVIINGDATRLTQVVTNLISNAIKYTPPGGRISVTLKIEGTQAVLRVSDSGVGLRKDQLDRVFELFAQGERSLARSEGGLGVGLTLVRRLAEMHGGAVVAQSDGPGTGSTFEVCLPLHVVSDVQVRADSKPSVAEPRHARGRVAPKRILIVDDNVDSANTMAALLTLKGHHVLLAHEGPTALAELQAFAPHLLLLDIGLPGMSGYDVARAVRSNPVNDRIVLCAMTGYGQNDDRRRSRDAGFDHHLIKPIDLNALDVMINDLSDLVKA